MISSDVILKLASSVQQDESVIFLKEVLSSGKEHKPGELDKGLKEYYQKMFGTPSTREYGKEITRSDKDIQKTKKEAADENQSIVWYVKDEFFRQYCMGYDFLKDKYPELLPNPSSIEKTHVKVKTLNETDPDIIYTEMRAENWSPNGEARELIGSLGISHISMSVGDIIQIGNKFLFVDNIGFVDITSGNKEQQEENKEIPPEKLSYVNTILDELYGEDNQASKIVSFFTRARIEFNPSEWLQAGWSSIIDAKKYYDSGYDDPVEAFAQYKSEHIDGLQELQYMTAKNKLGLEERTNPIPGGVGDKLQPEDVDKDQLEAGIKVEMEHVKNDADKTDEEKRQVAQDIVLDHLSEDKDYYTKLKKVEATAGWINDLEFQFDILYTGGRYQITGKADVKFDSDGLVDVENEKVINIFDIEEHRSVNDLDFLEKIKITDEYNNKLVESLQEAVSEWLPQLDYDKMNDEEWDRKHGIGSNKKKASYDLEEIDNKVLDDNYHLTLEEIYYNEESVNVLVGYEVILWKGNEKSSIGIGRKKFTKSEIDIAKEYFNYVNSVDEFNKIASKKIEAFSGLPRVNKKFMCHNCGEVFSKEVPEYKIEVKCPFCGNYASIIEKLTGKFMGKSAQKKYIAIKSDDRYNIECGEQFVRLNNKFVKSKKDGRIFVVASLKCLAGIEDVEDEVISLMHTYIANISLEDVLAVIFFSALNPEIINEVLNDVIKDNFTEYLLDQLAQEDDYTYQFLVNNELLAIPEVSTGTEFQQPFLYTDKEWPLTSLVNKYFSLPTDEAILKFNLAPRHPYSLLESLGYIDYEEYSRVVNKWLSEKYHKEVETILINKIMNYFSDSSDIKEIELELESDIEEYSNKYGYKIDWGLDKYNNPNLWTF